LHNEPHSVQGDPTQSACWGCGNTARDWKLASQRAGNAIIAANPGWLIIVEGTDTNPVNGASTWWGGDLSNAGNDPVVLNSPGHVVYSPHEYPASLYAQTWFSDPTYPNNMPAVWESHWGYLDTNNIAPVLIGEFGSRLTTTSDQQWLNALAIGTPGTGYIRSKSLNWTFWSWNPNSGDTGGILNDDWTTVIQAKQSILAQIQYPLIGSQSNQATNTPTRTATSTNTSPPTFQPPTSTSTRTSTPNGTPTRTPTNAPTNTATNTPPVTPVASALKVQYRNADNSPTDNQIKPHFQIVNTGSASVALNTLKIRYWFTGDAGATTYSTWCDYAAVSCSTVTFTVVTVSPSRSGADRYVEIGFTGGTLAAGANTGEIQTRFNKTDWSNFDETNDYSRGTATSFTDWNKVTLYQNGTLVWGVAP
jgi:endoglucanase